MSSGDRDQASRPERHGLTKFIRRASKIMRPKDRDSAASSPAPSATIPPAATDASATPGATAAAAAPNVGSSSVPAEQRSGSHLPRTVEPPFVRPATPKVEIIRSTPTTSATHFRLQEERARALFAKYNMQLEAGEWTRAKRAGPAAGGATTPPEWVEKKVRVRVHRQCHRCRTHYGGDKTCVQCGHVRCKKCPRTPDKSLRDPNAAKFSIAIDSDPRFRAVEEERRQPPRLTMLGKNGTELVRREPLHRVRRTCHKCDSLFAGRAKTCETCSHVRCPKCPREPAKEKKWPDGYPGDEEEKFPLAERTFRKARQRVRWQCHECNAHFRDGEHECRGCKHPRCDQCSRHPPKKVRREHDPDVIRSLEQRLGRMSIERPAAETAPGIATVAS